MQAINSDLALMLDGAFDLLRQGRQAYSARLIAQELGVVTSIQVLDLSFHMAPIKPTVQ